MTILVAEDDPITRRLLEVTLRRWEFEVVSVESGGAAWEALAQEDGPRLAILDWMMPGMDGPEICRLARSTPATRSAYLIFLTARTAREDLIAGLEAGADDYVAKLFDRAELRARINAGVRILTLQQELAARIDELLAARNQVKLLEGILPICSYCKRVREDENYWEQVESYVSAHSEAQFSHSVCPDCWRDVVEPQFREMGVALSGSCPGH